LIASQFRHIDPRSLDSLANIQKVGKGK